MRTILLIDDDPTFRLLLNRLLSAQGWTVIEAADGEKGIELAFATKPNVIICDLLMPRVNGFQVCREIRARKGSLPLTKVVVSTGSGYAADRADAMEAGADAFLTKPLRFAELFEVLKGLDTSAGLPNREELRGEIAAGAKLRFWGVRGSIPTPGPSTVYYGGNTSSIEIRNQGDIIILDAGTGIRALGQHLEDEFKDRAIAVNLLISHTHWDHIQGFPFFTPAYNPKNTVRIFAYEGAGKGLEATLSSQMESAYFPISMKQMPGNITIQELKDLSFTVGSTRVEAAFLNHPGVCVGYRVYAGDSSIVYLPDNELFQRQRSHSDSDEVQEYARHQDDKIMEFIRGADIAIMDSQYDASEYPKHVGWGHSCVDDVVALALQAGVKKLFLFHHDPDHDDARITKMLTGARAQVAEQGGRLEVEAAREGLEIVLEEAAKTADLATA